MDIGLICEIVLGEIDKFVHILPEVRATMNEAAFEEVCFFFYICVVKFENKSLTKEDCLKMINDKLNSIKKAFSNKIDEEKMYQLLKDLNYLRQFISISISQIKNITR
jgi:hypothetical protein